MSRTPFPVAPSADALRSAARSGLGVVLACAIVVAAVALLLRAVID